MWEAVVNSPIIIANVLWNKAVSPMFCKAPPSLVISVNDCVTHPMLWHSPSADCPVMPSDSLRFICSLPGISLLQFCPSADFIALTFSSPVDLLALCHPRSGILITLGWHNEWSTPPAYPVNSGFFVHWPIHLTPTSQNTKMSIFYENINQAGH